MDAIQIDRLTLEVPGCSEADGRRLALRVAEGLGALGFPASGRDLPDLRIDLSASSGQDADELARRIVDEVARQVRRLL